MKTQLEGAGILWAIKEINNHFDKIIEQNTVCVERDNASGTGDTREQPTPHTGSTVEPDDPKGLRSAREIAGKPMTVGKDRHNLSGGVESRHAIPVSDEPSRATTARGSGASNEAAETSQSGSSAPPAQNNLAAPNRAGIDSRPARPVIQAGSLPANPLNDPENPRYGSGDETRVVRKAGGSGGAAETVQPNLSPVSSLDKDECSQEKTISTPILITPREFKSVEEFIEHQRVRDLFNQFCERNTEHTESQPTD